MAQRNPDLLIAAVAAAVCAAVVVGASSAWVRTLFAVALLLVLPGYVLCAAIFKRLEVTARILFTLGLSLAVGIVGGLVLDLTPWGLRPWTWAVLLESVTAFAAAIAAARRDPAVTVTFGPRVRAGLALLPGVGSLLLVLGLVALLGVAIALARTPLRASHVAGYTALWIQPSAGEPGGAVVVGVESAELHEQQYRLDVTASGRTVTDRLTLKPGEHVQRLFSLTPGAGASPAATVSARLFRAGDEDRVYRRVALRVR